MMSSRNFFLCKMGKIQSWALTTVEVELKKYQADASWPQDEDQNISSSQSQRHWSGKSYIQC